MFIDNVTLMLICASASFMTIAGYLVFGLDNDECQGGWVAAFGIIGVVLLATGFQVTWIWPLPGQYNVAYGEPCILLGALMLGASVSLAKGWNLLPLAIPAFLFGGVALVIAWGFYKLGLSKEPLVTAIGFALSGIGGILTFIPLAFPRQKFIRVMGSLIMAVAGGLWAFTAYMGYYAHLVGFAKYIPAGMK